MFVIGDRVHWVGDPKVIGTVRKADGLGDKQSVFVAWDNDQAGNNFFSRALRLA
jgi:hypothetical protein